MAGISLIFLTSGETNLEPISFDIWLGFFKLKWLFSSLWNFSTLIKRIQLSYLVPSLLTIIKSFKSKSSDGLALREGNWCNVNSIKKIYFTKIEKPKNFKFLQNPKNNF